MVYGKRQTLVSVPWNPFARSYVSLPQIRVSARCRPRHTWCHEHSSCGFSRRICHKPWCSIKRALAGRVLVEKLHLGVWTLSISSSQCEVIRGAVSCILKSRSYYSIISYCFQGQYVGSVRIRSSVSLSPNSVAQAIKSSRVMGVVGVCGICCS